jgi:hypothetical protein
LAASEGPRPTATTRPNLFSEDDYLRGRPTKSILCLPLINQGRLTERLYLENTSTSYAFNPDRIAILNCWRRERRSRWRIDDADVGAFGGQRPNNCAPNSPRPAGNECHFAAEFIHNTEPFVLPVVKFVSSLRH